MRSHILLTALVATLLISFAAAVAHGEPAQFEHRVEGTRIYLDIHNRSWLAVEEVETFLYFYNSTGEVCHRELVYIIFETPIRPQGHEEVYITIPNISQYRPVRLEVSLRY